jgi:hypothetical protein
MFFYFFLVIVGYPRKNRTNRRKGRKVPSWVNSIVDRRKEGKITTFTSDETDSEIG